MAGKTKKKPFVSMVLFLLALEGSSVVKAFKVCFEFSRANRKQRKIRIELYSLKAMVSSKAFFAVLYSYWVKTHCWEFPFASKGFIPSRTKKWNSDSRLPFLGLSLHRTNSNQPPESIRSCGPVRKQRLMALQPIKASLLAFDR